MVMILELILVNNSK